MKYNEILKIKEKVDDLSVGIDPQVKSAFPNDTVLNSNANRKLFEKISIILDEILKAGGKIEKTDKRIKYPFYLTSEQIERIQISETPIAISTFTYLINAQVDNSIMKKLKATQITTWLQKNGYLSQIEHEDGKVFKILTEKSKEIGMSAELTENSYGRKYDINLYDSKAQKFILDNINMIASNVETY